MPTVVSLHGLASSPHGRKIAALRSLLAPDGIEIVAPDLNVPSFRRLSFDAIVGTAASAVAGARPGVLVGSSLGALAALAVARRAGNASPPLVLIAPAFALGERWLEKLAPGDPVVVFHQGEGRDLPIRRGFFEEMRGRAVESEPPPVPVTAFIGSADETVPCEGVVATWAAWEASGRLAPGSRLVVVDGGDHSLLAHVEAIAAAVKERLGLSSGA